MKHKNLFLILTIALFIFLMIGIFYYLKTHRSSKEGWSNYPVSEQDCLTALKGTWVQTSPAPTETEPTITFTFSENSIPFGDQDGEYSKIKGTGFKRIGTFWINLLDTYEDTTGKFSKVEMWPEILDTRLYPILVVTLLADEWELEFDPMREDFLFFIDYTGEHLWLLGEGEDYEFTKQL